MIFNILLSFSFIYGMFQISLKLNDIHFKENNPIVTSIIFSFIIALIYTFTVYAFILDLKTYFVSFFVTIILITFAVFKYKEILRILKNYINFKRKKNEILYKIIVLVLIFYIFSIFLPVSDIDSLRYHLEIPNLIKKDLFFKNYSLDYITIGATEFINLFGLNLNFEHSSSLINVTFLIIITFVNHRLYSQYKLGSNYYGTLAILASPYLVSVCTSQKLFVLPCYILIYSLIYLRHFNSTNRKIYYLIAATLPFAISIKFIFAPFVFMIYLYHIYFTKKINDKLLISLIYILSFLIFYFPICYLKYKVFGEPFIPLTVLNLNNIDWYLNFKKYLINYDYQLTLNNLFFYPIKLIYPLTVQFDKLIPNSFEYAEVKLFDISQIFKLMGIGVIYIFFIKKKGFNNYIILTLLIVCFLSINNLQNRWFLPILFYCAFYYNFKKNRFNNIFKFGLIFQSILIFLALLITSSLSIYGNFLDKNKILEHIAYGYKFSKELERNYPEKKIFSFIETNYYLTNTIPLYKYDIITKIDKNYFKAKIDNQDSFILVGDSIDFYNNLDKIFNTKNIRILRKQVFDQTFSGRFFVNKSSKKIFLYEIILD